MMEDLSESAQATIHEWTKEQVESAAKPNFGKLFVTAPNLIRLVGDVNGKSVLELGCGNGYWLRLLKELGAAESVGIDHAPNQIEMAKNWENAPRGIAFQIGDIAQPIDFDKQFDLVFLEHVLLEITTEEALKAVFVNAKKALASGGKLVVSDMHPFAPSSRPQNLRVSDDFNYFHDGANFEIASQRVDGETIYYKDCHWSLSTLFDAITSAGFLINKVMEPVPSQTDVEQYPEQLSYRLSHPMALMLEATPVA